MQPSYSFKEERPEDGDEVEYLFDLAFAPGRRSLSSYRLREGAPPVQSLSLVARDEIGVLAAAIRYWPVRIGAAGAPALLLGPVAVHPTRQGEGLGAVLIGDTLAAAKRDGWRRAVLVGDEPYYGRFGFSRAAAAAIDFPPPTSRDRILGRALVDGGFDGVEGVARPWDGPLQTH
ncbi:MAG: N-acetyltransferase [Pseudomonadota bacterium]